MLEFSDVKSSISGLVVPGDDQLALVEGWVDTDGVETSLELMNVDLTVSWLVKDLESINQVEVRLVSQINLCSLNLQFKVANFFQRVDKLVLLVERENWFP